LQGAGPIPQHTVRRFQWAAFLLCLSLAIPVPVLGEEEGPGVVDTFFETVQERFPYLRFRGYLSYTLGVDTQWQSSGEDHVEGRLETFLETRLDLTDNLLLVGSGRFWHQLWANGEVETDYSVELFEAYLDWLLGDFQVRLGQQIAAWGKTELASPMDILNPLDLTNFLDPNPEMLKIPVPMLRLNYFLKFGSLEGVWIPFFVPSQFHLLGRDFSLLKHSFPGIRFGGFLGVLEELGLIRFPDLSSLDSMDPRFRKNLEEALFATDYPPDDFLHGDYALSFTSTVRNFDFQLAYVYAWDDLPVWRINPCLVKTMTDGTLDGACLLELLRRVEDGDLAGIYSGGFYRMHVVGGGVSTAWRSFAFHGETAYYSQRAYYDENLQPFYAPVLFSTLGVDYMYSDWLVLNLQVFNQSMLSSRKQALGYDADTYGFTFYYTGTFLDGSLTPEFRGVYFVNNGDLFINPRITYSFGNHFYLALGAAFFEGSGTVDFRTVGQLLRVTPLTFFTENDWVYAKLQFTF